MRSTAGSDLIDLLGFNYAHNHCSFDKLTHSTDEPNARHLRGYKQGYPSKFHGISPDT